ncbi:hypothetical protein ACXR2U_13985 [Jatrophihabitans sp. YIM 134969]
MSEARPHPDLRPPPLTAVPNPLAQPEVPTVRYHRRHAGYACEVQRWLPTDDPRTWRANLRYEPGRAVITVHGDAEAAADEVERLVELSRSLRTPVIDVYLPDDAVAAATSPGSPGSSPPSPGSFPLR